MDWCTHETRNMLHVVNTLHQQWEACREYLLMARRRFELTLGQKLSSRCELLLSSARSIHSAGRLRAGHALSSCALSCHAHGCDPFPPSCRTQGIVERCEDERPEGHQPRSCVWQLQASSLGCFSVVRDVDMHAVY